MTSVGAIGMYPAHTPVLYYIFCVFDYAEFNETKFIHIR